MFFIVWCHLHTTCRTNMPIIVCTSSFWNTGFIYSNLIITNKNGLINWFLKFHYYSFKFILFLASLVPFSGCFPGEHWLAVPVHFLHLSKRNFGVLFYLMSSVFAVYPVSDVRTLKHWPQPGRIFLVHHLLPDRRGVSLCVGSLASISAPLILGIITNHKNVTCYITDLYRKSLFFIAYQNLTGRGC